MTITIAEPADNERGAYMPINIDHLTEEELGVLAGRVVLAIGMQPQVVVTVPPPVEGVSWHECYQRGLDRLAKAKIL